MLTERARCPDPKCGAYEGHHVLCDLQSVEHKASQAVAYYYAWLEEHKRYSSLYDRHKKGVTFWQGKFRMVKHENNTLRKKLNKNDAPAI